jgi:succinyl-diaminopimelate desuccinylase
MTMRARLDTEGSVTDLTRALMDIPSESGSEAALADAIESVLVACAHLEVLRDGDAVVARTMLGRAQRVIIAGHIDTVPINANVPSRSDEVNGQPVIWGRGAVDMKAGCAVALKLAVELTEPTVDVTWIFYDHEEVSAELNGLGRLGRTQPQLLEGDFAILGEPSNASIEGGCNGTLRVEVRTVGRRAHSARAWTGENAIHALTPALAVLSGYEAETIVVDGLAYREGLSAVGVRGGVAANVIPDEAVLTVNYRFAPDKSEAEAEAHVRSVFSGFDVVVVDSAAGARPGLTSAIAAEFVAAVGGEPQPKYGWTDVARFSALGIPAVNFGPGDPELAHTDDESVPVAQIETCESVLRAWLGSSRA